MTTVNVLENNYVSIAVVIWQWPNSQECKDTMEHLLCAGSKVNISQ